jgi:hypothetical protein
MNLEAVRAFVAVAEEGQFQLAADHLDTSQQALSKRLAALETDLGVRLLNRSAAGTRLTIEHARPQAAGEGGGGLLPAVGFPEPPAGCGQRRRGRHRQPGGPVPEVTAGFPADHHGPGGFGLTRGRSRACMLLVVQRVAFRLPGGGPARRPRP